MHVAATKIQVIGKKRGKPNIVNLLPHDKILDQTKSKAFADDKLNVTKMIIPVFDRVENIVGKREIACLHYKFFENTVGKGEIARNEQFLLFPQCFQPILGTYSQFHQT